MNDKRIGISMTNEQVSALNTVLEALDQGRDVRVLMRNEEFRAGRAVIARSAMRARRGDSLRLVKA